MDDLITQFIGMGLENEIDKRKDSLLLKDEIYRNDRKDLAEIKERYMALDITESQRMLIDDYMACAETAHCRASDICYIAGFQDAVSFLNKIGLLKN